MTKTIFALLATISLTLSAAPSRGGDTPGGPPAARFGIKGKVLESGTEAPVEFARISVYDMADSSFAGGALSSSDGGFEVGIKRPGRYRMEIQCIGFEKYTLNSISLGDKSPWARLKPTQLAASVSTLDDVVVTDRRNEVIYKVDRKQVQVAGNVNAVGNTAAEVLENTPGVEVDEEGNVSLRGNENFAVLIDGKPTVLTGSEALQQIPAQSIESIEIITNPSARYEPDGVSGIINIILREEEKGGLHGQVSLTAGTHRRYSGSANLTYRRKRHAFTAGYDFRTRSHGGDGTSERETFLGADTLFRDRESSWESFGLRHNIRGAYDFEISKMTSLSVNAMMRMGDHGNQNSTQMATWSALGGGRDSATFFDNKSEGDNRHRNIDANATFLHKFDKEGHELQVIGSLAQSGRNEQAYTGQSTDAGQSWLEWRDSSWTDESYQTLQVDYTRPIGDFKLETGAKSRTRQMEFRANNQPRNAAMEGQPANHFTYNDNIYALYAMGSGKAGSWEYQLGLRGEYATVNMTQKSDGSNIKKNLFSLFPTLHFSNTFGENRVMAGYSRRVYRPSIWLLNPYLEYDGTDAANCGNPDLGPEFSHSAELNYLRYFGKSTFSGTVYYRYTEESISSIVEMQDIGVGEEVLVHTFANMDSQSSLGVEANVRHSFAKWFQIDGNYGFSRERVIGQADGVQADVSSLRHSLRVNATFTLAKRTTLSAFGMYFSPTQRLQMRWRAFYGHGINIRQQLFKGNRGTLTLGVRNPIGKIKRGAVIETAEFREVSLNIPWTPNITFGFSYRLGDGVRRERANVEQSEEYSPDMEM